MAALPVEISFDSLSDPSVDLSALIQEGFGPDGLGIVTISGVPGFPALRDRLLPLAAAVAALPEAAKAALEDPGSRYNVGWSHGKEALAGGRPDTLKGSFYANPCRDTYGDRAASDVEKYRDYYTDNRWPREHLPELEPALKSLGQLMVSVGHLLADRCSDYVNRQLAVHSTAAASSTPAADADADAGAGAGAGARGSPARGAAADQARGGGGSGVDFGAALRDSACHRARLLHYFPPAGSGADDGVDWCGWHFDHGALTALTCAMYLGPDGAPVPNPDPTGGLYIRDRSGRTVQAAIPPGHIAFQMGQAMAIQSGGLLHATPHYVRASRPGLARGVSRNTFAVFLQPDVTFEMRPPRGVGASSAAAAAAPRRPGDALTAAAAASPGKLTAAEAAGWRPGMSFGAFAEAVMGAYYADAAPRRDTFGSGGIATAAGGAAAGSQSPRRQMVVHVEAE